MNFGKFVLLFSLYAIAMQARAQSATEGAPQLVDESRASPAAQVADPAKDEKQKLVCKREVVTGSRFAKKVCMTQAERDELRRATREALRDAESKPQNPYKDMGG